ncbi:MAG: sulfite exporter TauE/SafE family protein [Myxococcales bacterium]|nr:sulfite exporter TauE/SafE family protein [Myxococcales bacterium]
MIATLGMTTLALGVALAVLIGVSLGLLGGGGSILTVPILVYVLGLPPHEAIATSLFVVGVTSLAALVPHAREGRVRWKMGALFGVASMVGAYGAGRVAKLIPAVALLLLFGAMMLVTAIAMMRKGAADPKEQQSAGEQGDLPYLVIALEGLVVGAFTGLVGAGGGFLVVPALLLLGRLPMRQAVATSLMVIAMKSFAGFAGYLSTTPIDWRIAAMIATAAVIGSFLGAGFAGRVRQDLLRRGFAWFVVTMAVFILAQEIPKAAGLRFGLATHWPVILGMVLVPIALGIASLARAAKATPSGPPAPPAASPTSRVATTH